MRNWKVFAKVAMMLLMMSSQTAWGMQIFVKTQTNESITLEVNTVESIESIKALIEERKGIPSEEQYLFWNGKLLQEGKTLSDYNIQNTSTLYLAPETIGSISINETLGAYEIKSTANLDDLAVYVNGTGTYSTGGDAETTAHNCIGYVFKMTANITYTYTTEVNAPTNTENNYTAIGRKTGDTDSQEFPFCGTFDGQEHKVIGIRIYKNSGNVWADSYQGLFGYVKNGTVKNVDIDDTRITGYQNVGGIVGMCQGEIVQIDGCGIEANTRLEATANSVGGICGSFVCTGEQSYISNCHSYAPVTGYGYVGGICGLVTNASINTSSNSGNVCSALDATISNNSTNTSGYYAGGIAGACLHRVIINSCNNEAGVKADLSYVGGLVGALLDSSQIFQSSNSGEVSGINQVGGLVGLFGQDASFGTGSNDVGCANSGKIKGIAQVGGLVGYAKKSQSSCKGHNSGPVQYSSMGGARYGYAEDPTVFDICTKDTNTTGQGGSVTAVLNIKNLTTIRDNVNNGSYNYEGKTIKLETDLNLGSDWKPIGTTEHPFRGTFDGNGHSVHFAINAPDKNYQGLFGYMQGTVKNLFLDDCSVTGKDYVGAIAGYCHGTIVNCDTKDSSPPTQVTGNKYVGGVAGMAYYAEIHASYNSFNITGSQYVGGIVGSSDNSYISDCLYLGSSVGGNSYVGSIVGKNMKNNSVGIVNNCYSTSTTLGAVGDNDNGTVTNCGPAHTITLGTDVALANATTEVAIGSENTETIVGDLTIYGNFALQKGSTIYSAEGNTVELCYKGTLPADYSISYSYNDGTNYYTISGNTFQMPAKNVTVTAFINYWAKLQEQLANASQNALEPTVITLDHDCVAGINDKRLEVPAGRHAVIDLNGHTIDRHLSEATNSGHVIAVMNNGGNTPASLVIRDSKGGGIITGGYTSSTGGGISVSGTLTLEGGTITDNRANVHGGALNVGGTFIMTGGTITDNSANGKGSAIHANQGSINLQGGTITANRGKNAIYTTTNLTVSGTYNVSENIQTDGTAAPDIVLSGSVIKIAAAINPTKPSSVAFDYGGPTLTNGWSTYMNTVNPADCFTPSTSSRIIARIGNELSLGTPETLYWNSNYAHDGSSEEKAYIITMPEGLEYLATYVNGGNNTSSKFFKLDADIDMSGIANLMPIGNNDNKFCGTFDGQEHTISGLTINQPDNDYVGLFGYVYGGTVKNVTLSGANITGKDYVGGIAGNSKSCAIQYCFVLGTSITATSYKGAIIGKYDSGVNLNYNYYHNCTATENGTPQTTNIGTSQGDINEKNGAMQAVALADNADNSSVIADNVGAHGVYLEGRTLYRDGDWNTLCLPFDVTDGDKTDGISFSGTPLEGAEVRELTAASFSGTTLTLTFSEPVAIIEAGRPCIIKWAKAATNIVNPLFRNVFINNKPYSYNNVNIDARVQFLGTYKSTTFENEDRSILFLGTENKLYYPVSGARIGAQRAYFQLNEELRMKSEESSIKEVVLSFGEEDEETSLTGPTPDPSLVERGDWYDLSGRMVNGQWPTAKGIYIKNGKKILK